VPLFHWKLRSHGGPVNFIVSQAENTNSQKVFMSEAKSPKETETLFGQVFSNAQSKDLDEKYLKIWAAELEHTKTRWTVSTFFFSVSFAIFGFSFQAQLSKPLPNIARITGLVIYWFAYLIFNQFNQYTRLLREYLKELEDQDLTSIKLQTKLLQKSNRTKRVTATKLLIYFGILYTFGVIALWLLKY